ncbi:hypothetical protein BY996DRAFT_3918690 [Phakopsora pachyrhizi]|nr:hypothetical protein BY996DRAFT_3918690 [Phakopsora pachyrhizi]
MQSNLSVSQHASPHLPLTPNTTANASTSYSNSITACTTNPSEDGSFPEQEEHNTNLLDPQSRRKSQNSELFCQIPSSSCSTTALTNSHSPSSNNLLICQAQNQEQQHSSRIYPAQCLNLTKPYAIHASNHHSLEPGRNPTIYSPLGYANELGLQNGPKLEESDGRSSSSLEEEKPGVEGERANGLSLLGCQGSSSSRGSNLGLDIRPPAHHLTLPLPPHLDPRTLAAVRTKIEMKHWEDDKTVYFQIIHNGVPVGRVRESGLVNGTKLLNLTKITRGKRDGILKNEKVRKVVKHGTMHLKGVWIEYSRAVYLAEQYKISHLVYPLLDPNLDEYVGLEPTSLIGPRHPAEATMMLPGPRHSYPSFESAHVKLSPLTIDSHRGNSSYPQGVHSGFDHSNWSSPRPIHSPTLSYPEPCSAPPIPSYHGNQRSFYDVANFHPLNGDLSERRHTVHSALEGYNNHAGPQFNFNCPPNLTVYSTYSTPTSIEFSGYPTNTHHHQQQTNHSIPASPNQSLDCALSKPLSKGMVHADQHQHQRSQNSANSETLSDSIASRPTHSFGTNLTARMTNKSQAL